MIINKLSWDSQFFGFNVGKIDGDKISSIEDLKKILLEAKNLNYRLCYLLIPCEYISLNEIAKSQNGLLIDEKVTYSINDIYGVKLDDSSNISEFDKKFSLKEMYELGIQSSHQSRFRIDKNFERNACDKMYKIWIEKSIDGELAEKVFIYTDNNAVKGMITIKIYNGIGKIILIGVDSEERGKSIGKKLIQKSFEYFISSKVYKVDVDTQNRNIDACRFYEKCGFSKSKTINVYHYWL